MEKWGMNQLAGRDDALAWAVLLMAAHLEESGRLDGPRYCQDLRARGELHGSAGLATSQQAMEWLASMLEDARQTRLQREESPGGRG